ncbi:MAG: S41 family peptidase [Bacteroidia bacterium]|nr:S41 family peptidase [Bacteroidia bacterium]
MRNFLITFGILTLGLTLGFKIDSYLTPHQAADVDKGVKKFEQALAFIERNYITEPNHEELVDNAIKGVLEELDPHSFYIGREEMMSRDEEMSGSFEGIGIEYNLLDDTLYIINPLAGGPSEKAGIKSGDKIIKIDGELLEGARLTSSFITHKLKGIKDSKVKISVKRKGYENLLDFIVTRDKIPLYSVPYAYQITPETGYMQISSFSETTYDEFVKQLNRLKQENIKNLILDLRGNPGGYLLMAKNIADEFLPAGKKIVSTKGRGKDSQQEYNSTNSMNSFEEGGLIILVDYGTASASEILSGAVQDHDRGLILGVRTFGKGLVQVQKKFDDGSAMRIVVSEYFTPSGRCIQKPYNKPNEQYDNEIEERFKSGEIYDQSKIHFADSMVYHTDAGRTVYGGGGIVPDVFIPDDTTSNSKYLALLFANDVFRSFAFRYVDNHSEIRTTYPHSARFIYEFETSNELLREFVNYAAQKGAPFDEKGYITSMNIIKTRIKAYIGKRLFQDDGYYPALHESDPVIQKALELMPAAYELQKTGRFTLR